MTKPQVYVIQEKSVSVYEEKWSVVRGVLSDEDRNAGYPVGVQEVLSTHNSMFAAMKSRRQVVDNEKTA